MTGLAALSKEQVVLDEMTEGDADAVARRLALAEGLPVLEATEEAERLANQIVSGGAIPKHAVRDTAHIAIAAVQTKGRILTIAPPAVDEMAGSKCPSYV